jgi:hypothetical protein
MWIKKIKNFFDNKCGVRKAGSMSYVINFFTKDKISEISIISGNNNYSNNIETLNGEPLASGWIKLNELELSNIEFLTNKQEYFEVNYNTSQKLISGEQYKINVDWAYNSNPNFVTGLKIGLMDASKYTNYFKNIKWGDNREIEEYFISNGNEEIKFNFLLQNNGKNPSFKIDESGSYISNAISGFSYKIYGGINFTGYKEIMSNIISLKNGNYYLTGFTNLKHLNKNNVSLDIQEEFFPYGGYSESILLDIPIQVNKIYKYIFDYSGIESGFGGPGAIMFEAIGNDGLKQNIGLLGTDFQSLMPGTVSEGYFLSTGNYTGIKGRFYLGYAGNLSVKINKILIISSDYNFYKVDIQEPEKINQKIENLLISTESEKVNNIVTKQGDVMMFNTINDRNYQIDYPEGLQDPIILDVQNYENYKEITGYKRENEKITFYSQQSGKKIIYDKNPSLLNKEFETIATWDNYPDGKPTSLNIYGLVSSNAIIINSGLGNNYIESSGQNFEIMLETGINTFITESNSEYEELYKINFNLNLTKQPNEMYSVEIKNIQFGNQLGTNYTIKGEKVFEFFDINILTEQNGPFTIYTFNDYSGVRINNINLLIDNYYFEQGLTITGIEICSYKNTGLNGFLSIDSFEVKKYNDKFIGKYFWYGKRNTDNTKIYNKQSGKELICFNKYPN